mgnify:CR=1 FL=1|jgi:Skp family chaperone for outer membrane proteins
MSIKSILSAALLAASIILGATVPSVAQNPNDNSGGAIAIIDYQRLLHESIALKDANRQIEAKFKEFDTSIKARQKELQKAEEELGRQRTVLSPEAFQKRKQELIQDVANFNRMQNSRSKQIEEARAKAFRVVDEHILVATQKIAKENRYFLIFRRQNVYMASGALDITDTVLAELNKSITKLPVNFK